MKTILLLMVFTLTNAAYGNPDHSGAHSWWLDLSNIMIMSYIFLLLFISVIVASFGTKHKKHNKKLQ